jgi:hypothetical protein
MTAPALWTALLTLSYAAHIACAPAAGQSTRKGNMAVATGTTNELAYEFSVPYRVKSSPDLIATVTLKNLSSASIRINAITLDSGTLVLKFKKTDETPVRTGPPPLPSRDDGNIDRVVIDPGQSTTFTYRGTDLFPGSDLENGDYLVRFVYRNANAAYHDWIGSIETEWLSFELQK